MNHPNTLKLLNSSERNELKSKLKERWNRIQSQRTDGKHLSAFISLDTKSSSITEESLEVELRKKLPGYMIPQEIQFLEDLPKNPNGKTDKKTLESRKFVQARIQSNLPQTDLSLEDQVIDIFKNRLGLSDIEKSDNFFNLGGDSILAIQVVSDARKFGIPVGVSDLFKLGTPQKIASRLGKPTIQNNSEHQSSESLSKILSTWENVLGQSYVSEDDNFFNSGGDSILAIRLVSELRKKRLDLSVSLLFKNPTPKALSSVINKGKQSDDIDEQSTDKTQPKNDSTDILSPIQLWFLERSLKYQNHWNQSVLLTIEPSIEYETIETALLKLYQRHEAFRLRVETGPTSISTSISPNSNTKVPIQEYRIETDSIQSQSNIISKVADSLHASIRLDEGLLLKATCFKTNNSSRLLLVAHHLCIDAVSWNIIISDLGNLLAGQDHSLSSLAQQRQSLTNWNSELEKFSSNPDKLQIDFWRSRAFKKALNLPFDQGDLNKNTERFSQTKKILISEEATGVVSKKLQGDRASIFKILIAAVCKTLKEWLDFDYLLIGIEEHGRAIENTNAIGDGTVGWLTSFYPAVFDLRYAESHDSILNEVQHTLGKIGDYGITYGLARYKSSDEQLRSEFQKHPDPEIIVNYLGNLDYINENEGTFQISKTQIGTDRHPDNQRTSIFEINAWIQNGRLQINWSYATSIHNPSTIEKLTESLYKNLKRYGSESTVRSDALNSEKRATGIPLTDSQQNLVLHRLNNLESDLGKIRIDCEVTGPTDKFAIEKTWNSIVNSHPTLRSTLDWKTSDSPTITVHSHYRDNVKYKDLSTLPESDRELALETLTEDVHQPSIELDQLPINQIVIAKLSNNSHKLTLFCHHIFLDGWSSALLLQQFAESLSNQTEDHLSKSENLSLFLEYQDSTFKTPQSPSVKFWRINLKNIVPCHVFPNYQVRFSNEMRLRSTLRINLKQELSKSVSNAARRSNTTTTTLYTAAWCLTLRTLTNQSSICFGNTVSGRALPIQNIEKLIANLSQVVPFYIKTDLGDSIDNLLAKVADTINGTMDFSKFSSEKILQWIEYQEKLPPFDTAFSVAKYPEISSSSGISIENFKSGTTSTQKLVASIIVGKSDSNTLSLDYLNSYLGETEAMAVGDLYQTILLKITGRQYKSVSDCIDESPSINFMHASAAKKANVSTIEPPAKFHNAKATKKPSSDEESVIQAFRDILEIEECSPSDSFFNLGGTSLQAVQLFNKIEIQTGIRLPLSLLIKTQNPKGIAEHLKEGGRSNARIDRLVVIKESSGRHPIFFIHAAGLELLFYRELAETLETKSPIFGILPIGLDGVDTPPKDMGQIARDYIDVIRSRQPHGPYFIVGHCIGAVIAFEMASRLAEQNELVPLIVSIDGAAPTVPNYKKRSTKRSHVSTLTLLKQKLRSLKRVILHRIKMQTLSGEKRDAYIRERIRTNYRVAKQRYRTKPYEGRLLNFHCTDSERYHQHSDLAWKSIAPNARIVHMDCNHSEVLEQPYATKVAEIIDEELQSQYFG